LTTVGQSERIDVHAWVSGVAIRRHAAQKTNRILSYVLAQSRIVISEAVVKESRFRIGILSRPAEWTLTCIRGLDFRTWDPVHVEAHLPGERPEIAIDRCRRSQMAGDDARQLRPVFHPR